MNLRKALFLSLLAPLLFCQYAGAVLLIQRHSHALTLLPDGNLLVSGGVTDAVNTTTVSVQMYNMATNTYDNWGNLATARSSHTATLLSNGHVLVAGGFSSAGSPLSSLELCNTKTKTCAALGAVLSPAKGGHTATLLTKGANSGRVLLCGGQDAASINSVTADCDIFNPADGTVSNGPSMISPRIGHTASALNNGRVFVSGGRRRNQAGTAWIYEPMTEIYDPALAQWLPRDALLQGRINHTATVLNNGLVMIAGGYNSTTTFKCDERNLEGEDCWQPDDLEYWGYERTAQNMGSHGYIDGAEFFDQNGGRTVIGESVFGVKPYRVHNHSAALKPDGSWNMYGGYGNIVRTVFENSPSLDEASIIRLQRTGAQTANVLGTSVISFPITGTLARLVSGRFVDTDAFFSKPLEPDVPSIAVDTAEVFLAHSTAPLDGLAAGTLNAACETQPPPPGCFDNTVTLQTPSGRATFDEQTVYSDPDSAPGITVQSSALNFASPLSTGTPAVAFNGNMVAWVAMPLPDIYRGIKGTAYVESGAVMDPAGNYSLTIESSGSSWIDVPNPTIGDETLFITTISFTAVGAITNTGAAGDLNAPLNAAGAPITLTVKVKYTADEIRTGDRTPAFIYGRSDLVVRQMVFTSALGYTPASNSWKDLGDEVASPTLFVPVFNHGTLVTPAADTVVIGGRNCETATTVDCLRANKTFTATRARVAFIPVHRSLEGNDGWTKGESMSTRRAWHTSTVLADGRILTCGGSDGTVPLSSCELLNPATRKWEATGSMFTARTRHTATLLPNGKVLVTGGATPLESSTQKAEIYDPATGRWAHTTAMAEGRQNHTATLLPNGNVLVAGGNTVSTYSATTEVYISSTAYWKASGSMTTPRAQHTATLMKNGTVVMAGGVNGFGAIRAAERYNYLTWTFSGAGNMNSGRFGHTATLLRDNRLLVAGGSDNEISQMTGEFYDGASWTYTDLLYLPRTNHRTVLLPNGKIMLTGGEAPGASQSRAEGYDPDWDAWTDQGKLDSGRSHHTTVLTRDNWVVNIGGWDGGKVLDTTDFAYFSYYPDMEGLSAATTRQPLISTITATFNYGAAVTLLSDTSNFHGITEAAGGGAGPANSSFHNPRLYLQQLDNQSGFMLDLSTRIYGQYGSSNTVWQNTLSSITVTMPVPPGEMPYGWYYARVAANGVFSEGRPVQVTIDRPAYAPSAPAATVHGTSSITWTWDLGDLPSGSADGYVVLSATDNVFITTVAFTDTASYTQAGLVPNTAASIMVAAYNIGGMGPLSKSATFYTLAAVPSPLVIREASFETALLEWSRNDNSEATTFEVSMSPKNSAFSFADPVAISTPVPFSVNYMSTSTVIQQLSPNQLYDFRVRARNGAGLTTDFTAPVATITISGVNNFGGEALSSSTINWAWDMSIGADYYELYDVTLGTALRVLVGTTTTNSLQQTALSANTKHYAAVVAVNTSNGNGPISGPYSPIMGIYTLTVPILKAVPNAFTNVSTGSLTANWITNGNSTWTVYTVSLTDMYGSTRSVETTDSRHMFDGLAPNVLHTVTVTPYNGDDKAGDTLSLGSKYTFAKVPASLTATEISMSGIALEWDQAGNSPYTVYEVRSSTSEAFAEPVTKHLPFSNYDTGSDIFVTGLLTSTSYYFDVSACNGEAQALACSESHPDYNGGVTARKRAVAAFTRAGPSGAPSGAVGGTSSPSQTSVITGTLPDNRKVQMTVPAGAFPTATAIAISSVSVSDNRCGYAPGGNVVALRIHSQDGAQPQEPVTLKFYFDQDLGKNTIITDASKLVLSRLNETNGQCLPLETTVNIGDRTVTATLNHFSFFQLVSRTASAGVSDILVYPNPFYMNRGQGFVTIDRIPASSKVRIYTLSGDKVWEATAGTTGMVIWKGVNSSGNLVASGIYLAVVDSTAGKKVLKLAVER